ncbi:MAG: sensor histidine kinase [Solirubrobacterales bacterium]
MEEGHVEDLFGRVRLALFTFGEDRKVIYANKAGQNFAPMIKPGMDLWDCLRPIISEEKIDRLLLKNERVVFSPGPDTPLLEWLVNDQTLKDGSRFLMAWDASVLDQIVERRITFVVGASHELRSPMTALLGFAEILDLERDTLNPAQAEAVEVIIDNARHLRDLLDDILDMTRVSFGEMKLNLGKIEVGPILKSVADTLRPQIDAKDQTVTVTIDPGLPLIEADPHRVRQIAVNLVDNAHAHSPPGTSIEVSVGIREPHLVIVVADDGDGMAFDDPEDAFKEFGRGKDDTEARVSGVGIGLTLTRGIVELHRGTIEVSSERGKGTRFEVLLPLDREEARQRLFAGKR